LPDYGNTKRLSFHKNTKLTNGKTSKLKRYFPNTENNANWQNYRRSAPKTFPSPSFPSARIKPSMATHIANIMSKNMSTMDELEDEVYSLNLDPEDKKVILTRMKYLYGNNLALGKSNLDIDRAAARVKQERAERLARLRAEARQLAATPFVENNLSNRLLRTSLQSRKPVASNNANLYSGGKTRKRRVD